MNNIKLAVILIFLLGLLTACFQTSTVTPTPTMPVPSPTKNEAKRMEAIKLLETALSKMDKAASYRFTISATHHYTYEGRPSEWKYEGQGAIIWPNRFQWTLSGQADVLKTVTSVDGKTFCADSRGERRDCTLAWGGIGPGSSPYTLIVYLRNFGTVSDLGVQVLGGTEHQHLAFSPVLAKVAAVDATHARDMAKVIAVDGEVWIDKITELPRQERVIVKYKSPTGQEETADTTLTFLDYGKPIEIKLP
ncbi:MAG: hypothetical protein M1136_12700 [Chloroflexi bacterium]|nr:hypothetical protein [Chloroflexota bacterium]MCL5076483.1 hypothetical protein [Chloroflexota bacterium]